MTNDQDDDRNAVVSHPGELVVLAEYAGKRGTLPALPKFDIRSFGGRELGEPDDDERPPRSAKHVASVSWSWSPAHGLSQTYWLCTDRKRSAWHLYQEWWDEYENMKRFMMVAYGSPYRGIAAKEAAAQLLLAAWQDKWSAFQSPGRGADVMSDGLLDSEDIARLEQLAFPE